MRPPEHVRNAPVRLLVRQAALLYEFYVGVSAHGSFNTELQTMGAIRTLVGQICQMLPEVFARRLFITGIVGREKPHLLLHYCFVLGVGTHDGVDSLYD